MTDSRTLTILAALVACLAVTACGSSQISSTSTGTARPPDAAAPAEAGGGAGDSRADGRQEEGGAQGEHDDFEPRPHHDAGGGAGQFEVKGGDNSIQEFGGEASGSEFDEAAAVLHGYLDARAAQAWSAACGYLAAGTRGALAEQLGGGQGATGCASALGGLSSGVPPSVLRRSAVADAGALRIEGDGGFLLFRGAADAAYFIPMAREDGSWKVAAIAPSALP